jgi:asparagine synthase (glutamine-hydrolysing)
VKVALSGQGADELFGGYRKHKVASIAGRWHRLPSPIRRAGAFGARHTRGELRRIVAALEPQTPEARVVAMSSILDPELRQSLFQGELSAYTDYRGTSVIKRLLERLPPGADPLSETLFVDAQFALADDMLHYFDRASMAHSLEVRVPFLDHEFVELAATVPPELKVRGTTTKHLLKSAARGILPDAIIDKRKIGFFHAGGSSTVGWLEAHAERSLAHYLLDPNARTAELLDRKTVAAAVDAHASGGRRSTRLLLALLLLEVWLSTYLPRATATAVDPRLAGALV